MRSKFDGMIAQLGNEMIEMGSMVEDTIEGALESLQNADVERAKQLMSSDDTVDRKERDIESLCIRMLLQQQPVARDLRVVSSALKMITDMERIGDQAADISEIVTMMDLTLPRPDHFGAMARAAIAMVHQAIDAYVHRDVAMAKQVIASDDVVDELFIAVKDELADQLRRGSVTSTNALDLMMIDKYLERIGDHATNIAEWVVYSVTGLYKGEELQ